MRKYVKKLVKKLCRKMLPQRFLRECFLEDTYARIRQIEYRSINRRFYAVEQIAEFLVSAQLRGDYCEFGVYKGDTFIHACRCIAPSFPRARFYAFDSFEGLPGPKDVDRKNGYASNFHEGEFACPEPDFLANLRSAGVDLSRVRTISGWFNDTLRKDSYDLDVVSAAWIDCDLYESTVPVLEFLTPHLRTGSVLAFDDWRCFRNLPDHGEQKACREWLARNPGIRLNDLFSFGAFGMVFTVQILESASA